MTKSPSFCAISTGAMDQLKASCRTQSACCEQQLLGLRDRIKARATGKASDVELERQAHVAYWAPSGRGI
jgi:hypothetical protein